MKRTGLTARLLLVESDPDFSGFLENALSQEFEGTIEVRRCGSLASALQCLNGERFDLVLLALELPDSTGLETAISILQLGLDTSVAVLCSARDREVAWETTRYGVHDVILKDGFTPKMLLSRLRLALEQHLLRQSLERSLRELELSNGRFLSLVVDNADAIIVVDAAGIVRFVNPAAEELLECSATDLLGEMLGVPLEGLLRCELDLVSRYSLDRVAEMRVIRSLWDGEMAHIATLRDITERKSHERELRIAKQTAEQASAMKSQFLANMSHELRTPLNSIVGFSEIILNEVMGKVQPHRYAEYIRHIHDCGSHLLSLINDLLDLSKAESGMLTLSEEDFDVAELVDAVLDIVMPQAVARKIRLRSTTLFRPLLVRADHRMVKQALLNLLSNALKFTGDGGDVSVDIRTDGRGDLRLVVVDTGIGIPRDQIPRAFAAFVQVENAYQKSGREGTGLGLALTKRLVELHGGTIRLESEENRGTTVTVVLPAWRVLKRFSDGANILRFEPPAPDAPKGYG
ncbi:MAG: ATP-binding protein [Kiloniellales bacterium]